MTPPKPTAEEFERARQWADDTLYMLRHYDPATAPELRVARVLLYKLEEARLLRAYYDAERAWGTEEGPKAIDRLARFQAALSGVAAFDASASQGQGRGTGGHDGT